MQIHTLKEEVRITKQITQQKLLLWWPGPKQFVKHDPDELKDQRNNWNSGTAWNSTPDFLESCAPLTLTAKRLC